MPMRWGFALYALASIVILVAKPGPVGRYARARAFSAGMARRPESLEIKNASALLENPVRSGLLVPVGDGRYYLDPLKYRRRRRLLWGAIAVAGLVIGAAAVLMEL